MGIRKILSGSWRYEVSNNEIEELKESVHLAVITKVPEKYLLIDLENGKMYRGSNENNEHIPGYKLWKDTDKE
jgi:hypothetical protein